VKITSKLAETLIRPGLINPAEDETPEITTGDEISGEDDERFRCPDCGERGEIKGHMTCQYPKD